VLAGSLEVAIALAFRIRHGSGALRACGLPRMEELAGLLVLKALYGA